MKISIMVIIILLSSLSQAQYPDPKLTPGVVDPAITWDTLCLHSTKERRHVTKAMKDEVCRRYKKKCGPGKQEIDHFIPLCAGGKNDLKNLWPEPYTPTPAAHQKDKLETWLCSQICQRKISIPAAQEKIRTDWVKAARDMERVKAANKSKKAHK